MGLSDLDPRPNRGMGPSFIASRRCCSRPAGHANPIRPTISGQVAEVAAFPLIRAAQAAAAPSGRLIPSLRAMHSHPGYSPGELPEGRAAMLLQGGARAATTAFRQLNNLRCWWRARVSTGGRCRVMFRWWCRQTAEPPTIRVLTGAVDYLEEGPQSFFVTSSAPSTLKQGAKPALYWSAPSRINAACWPSPTHLHDDRQTMASRCGAACRRCGAAT